MSSVAQWTNSYPRVAGYGHHVYLEGYDLPTLSSGLTDPAASPDGRSLAFASHGWLWVLDLDTGVARRLTTGGAMDARPTWSPDSQHLAFVRDTGRETSIVRVDVVTGQEELLANTDGLDLDPAYSPDGRHLVYASADDRGIGLRQLTLGTRADSSIYTARGLALNPVLHPDGEHLLYMAKAGTNEVRLHRLPSGEERTLYTGYILSQTEPALSPDGQRVALNVPTDDGWELLLIDVDEPTFSFRLLQSSTPPLAPAWSADGQTLYFAQADADEHLRLMQVPAAGGPIAEVNVQAWDWGTDLGLVTIRTTINGNPAPTRLSITDANGHPLLPDEGQAWFDGETAQVYVYSPGELTLRVPQGTVRVTAVQGLATPAETATITVEPATEATANLALESVWDATGWHSGDQHFHLNYGGPYRLAPDDLLPVMAGEALDVAGPIVANLHNRYIDDELWGHDRTSSTPYIAFGQEIRSHFFGHVALVGSETLFDPWIWGPGYGVFGRDDRENATAIAHARSEGGMGVYVHPVGTRDPFASGAEGSVPTLLVADGVLGDVDAIELVCLWTDDLGTAEVWYRLLNLGRDIVPTAGSDVMTNFYRTMAPGTARSYVQTEGNASYQQYLDALRAGRSFVTTGPFLEAEIASEGPGGVVSSGEAVPWSLTLASAVPVDRVEVLVNGVVVDTDAGLDGPGQRSYEGTLSLPAGGWVAFRAVGNEAAGWPTMATYPFAHTAPVWINQRGGTDPDVARQAAQDLLRVLDTAEARFERAYDGVDAPALRDRFERARAVLEDRL